MDKQHKFFKTVNDKRITTAPYFDMHSFERAKYLIYKQLPPPHKYLIINQLQIIYFRKIIRYIVRGIYYLYVCVFLVLLQNVFC